MTQQELDISISDIIIKEFLKLKEKGIYNFYDFGNVAYRFLERFNLIDLNNDKKNELMKESERQFRANLIKRNQDLTLQGKNILKVDLERAFEQIEQGSNPTFQNQIKIGAMRIAVYNFIKNCVEQEFDLEKEITNKIKEYNYDYNR